MKRFFLQLIIFLLLSISLAWGQKGDLFLYNYQNPIRNIDYQNRAVLQDESGLMYFANNKGIITYDGVRWQLTSTLSTPYALAKSPLKDIPVFVGCSDSFGYLEEDIKGELHYKSISSANKRFGEITQIEVLDKHIFFYSDKVLFRVSRKTLKVEKVWIARPETPFAGFFSHKQKVFLNVSGKGLHQIQKEELIPQAAESLTGHYINTALPFNDEQVLIGTSSSKLMLFDGENFEDLEYEAKQYISENFLTRGINLSNQEFALATVSGGCIIINKEDLSTTQTINYQTGLPDDEVLALFRDNYGGVWICTEYSITRADIHLPISNFSEYPGLEGKITGVRIVDNTLYTATIEGLYYLEKINRFEELITVVKKEQEKLIETQTRIERTFRISDLQDKSRVGKFFQSVFGSQDKERKAEKARRREERRKARQARRAARRGDSLQIEENIEEEIDPVDSTEKYNPDLPEIEDDEQVSISSSISKVTLDPVYTSKVSYEIAGRKLKKTYALQSIPFVYKKAPNLRAKCKQMLVYENQLLVATNIGLFVVIDKQAQQIMSDTYVNFIYQSTEKAGHFYVGTNEGLRHIRFEDGRWRVSEKFKGLNISIGSICGKGKEIWLGCENQVYRVELNDAGKPALSKRYIFSNNYLENIVVRYIAGEPRFFASTGIYRYNAKQDKPELDPKLSKYFNERSQILYSQQNYTWIKPEATWVDLSKVSDSTRIRTDYLSLFSDIEDIYIDEQQNLWVINHLGLFRVEANAKAIKHQSFKVYVRSIKDNKGNALPIRNLKLNYKNGGLVIYLAAPFYLNERDIEYQYQIVGYDQGWSPWRTQTNISFPVLPSGKYDIRIRARNLFGQISEELKFEFEVKPPYWETWWFYILSAFLLMLAVIVLLKIRTNALKAANQRLEEKVRQKTAEIEEQKNQLEIAFGEIKKQNRHITSSIRYAQKIQQAILPVEDEIYRCLTDSFILFRPRDVVSGDFYWFEEKKDCYILVAADCTGHGVPGAFMSMIGDSLLNQIINEKGIYAPNQILDELNLGVVRALKQDYESVGRYDGMDISVCKIDKNRNTLHFAGANNALYIVSNGQLKTIRADRQGIGGLQRKRKPFTAHTIEVSEDTYFYLSSDGYADQFGGEQGRKFMKNNFRKLLQELGERSGGEQKAILTQTLNQWKGNYQQIDDILVIGFRLGV